MKANNILVTVLIALAVGSAGFFGGMKYQQSKTPTSMGQFGRNGGPRVQGLNQQRPGGFNAQGLRPVAGEIISQDDKSITVKLGDGSSKIVLFSDTTSINKAAEGTKGDLKVGDSVRIFGIANSDGSVTAQNIQLNPVNPANPESPAPAK